MVGCNYSTCSSSQLLDGELVGSRGCGAAVNVRPFPVVVVGIDLLVNELLLDVVLDDDDDVNKKMNPTSKETSLNESYACS